MAEPWRIERGTTRWLSPRWRVKRGDEFLRMAGKFSTIRNFRTEAGAQRAADKANRASGVPAVDRSQFGKPGSQPALVEAVLQSGVEFATVCERIGEGRGGERAPYRDAFYDAVARLAAAAGVTPCDGSQPVEEFAQQLYRASWPVDKLLGWGALGETERESWRRVARFASGVGEVGRG